MLSFAVELAAHPRGAAGVSGASDSPLDVTARRVPSISRKEGRSSGSQAVQAATSPTSAAITARAGGARPSGTAGGGRRMDSGSSTHPVCTCMPSSPAWGRRRSRSSHSSTPNE